MASVATRPMTAEEFCDFVHRSENHDRCFELDQGEIVEMPPPNEQHGAVCGNIAGFLWQYTREQGRGHVLTNDTGILLQRDPDTVRGADAALYLDQRTFAEMKQAYVKRLPTLVAEVLSPGDRMCKMVKRINQFLARSVAMVWLFEPDARTVTVWRSQHPQVVLEAVDELTGFDVLPDFRCQVAAFFSFPGEAVASTL